MIVVCPFDGPQRTKGEDTMPRKMDDIERERIEKDQERPVYGQRDRDEVAIPVVEEQINVGKRVVEKGGVRVKSNVEEVPVEGDVNLREEHVRVERRPVDRPLNQADADAFREGTIEVSERAEVPVVDKRARVVEEVVVGKEVREHQERISDTVKRTDVDVEEIDNTKPRRK
jgi:uncharacterized protein (TIGR02271 family)